MNSPDRIAYVDGPRLRRSLLAACDYAQLQRGELNRINVFPVPDGDTGTNLALTVRAIADRLRTSTDRSAALVAAEAAQASVLGARGNCGMMLSHFLLGFATGLEDRERVTPQEFSAALQRGVDNLYEALETPVEGTILTVMRESAEAAGRSGLTDFEPLLTELVARAKESLSRTPDLLPVLKEAGVVDAGGKGFVSLLEGALLFMHGDPIVSPQEEVEHRLAAAEVEFSTEAEQFRFCTEALVRGEGLPDQAVVRGDLRDRGDSLIVIRSQDVLKIHIHTDEPAEVFDYLRGLGDLVAHKAEDMKVQSEAVGRAAAAHVTIARRPITIVTDSAADLSEEVLQAHGIHVVRLVLMDGDHVLRDGLDITASEFHARLGDESGNLPTTSQPAPAAFLEAFDRAAEDGEQVVAVLLGSSLSGTYSSAEAAARRFEGAPVHLVDTLGASLLEGLLVLKACELAELGWAPGALAKELARVRAQSGILFTVETFDRLLASGRVGRGRALLGSMLNVKPILALNTEGVVEPAGKVLGSKRVLTTMVEEVSKRIPTGARRLRFGIVHVGAPHLIHPVTEALRRRYGPGPEIHSAPATPVISTHLGVGAWGLAFLVED